MTDKKPIGAGAWRLSTRPLAVQLALFSALVTALVAGTAFAILRMRAETEVRRVFVAELGATQRALAQLQFRNLRLLLSTSSSLSTNPSLRAAIGLVRVESNAGAARRQELSTTIQREVDRLFAEQDADLLVVTDDSGRVLAAKGRRGQPRVGEDLSRAPVVRYALEAERATADSSFGVLRVGSAPLQVGCVAILLNGYPIGTLILGERLDRLMPRPDAELSTEAIVTAGNTVLASTSGAEPLTLGGEDFVAASISLGRIDDGRPATLHLLRSLSASLDPIERSLSQSFLFAGVFAVLLIGSGAVVVTRTTLQPFARFVAFMRAGADSGAYARFDEPYPAPEIGTLTDAYNRLIDSLSQHHVQLEQRSADLARSNQSLRDQVRERERAERALRQSEDQLRQSQKLEALGTLAGGVAHDFNNLLSVILGYADLSRSRMPVGSQERQDLEEISNAAQRATELVTQLLAFSRKQVLQPQIVDLNRIITDMKGLLRPLIGENISVTTELEPVLARIKADPGQIEQVIVNLVVNARDAMPTGGAIVIATANVSADDRESASFEDSSKPMVMLSVRDNGSGMDAATRERIFEPFFTTKAPGKGTGLGLSTVYGIVRQSEGNITVETALGAGCMFRCHFPATAEVRQQSVESTAPEDAYRGSETVLVVEDETQLRALICRSLVDRGYNVLQAPNGQDALEVAAAYTGSIHLLVTDVVMPLLSGKELAERLQSERPGLPVIFISGYSADAIERHGILAPDSVFLQKPVRQNDLARTIRELLEAQQAVGSEA